MIPLFTTSQIRGADKFAIEKLKIPGIVLMENAAQSIFHIINKNLEISPVEDKIAIICGKGNNGGDGFALARHLVNNGYHVQIISLANERELKGDALTNYSIVKKLLPYNKNLSLIFYKTPNNISKLDDCTIIIDALLGTGIKGKVKEPYNLIIDGINKLPGFKIAIDIPSGLESDKGTGSNVINADLTITLAELKKGLYFGMGYKYSGEVFKGSIGIGSQYFDEQSVDTYLIEPEDALMGIPTLELDAHKYSVSKVLVIAGSGYLPNASFLTTNSALIAGAGSVVLAFPKSIKSLAHQKLTEATVLPYEDLWHEYLLESNVQELREKIKWADVVVMGPGLTRNKETLEAVRKIIKEFPAKKFVIDADAIVAMANGHYKKLKLKNTVLTPHYKEFATLLGINIEDLQNDILGYGKKFAIESGAILVLKGAPTIVFTPQGDILINSSGNPGMAKFGTGDVLAGAIAAFIAKSSEIENSVFSAVYLHSLSADLLAEKKSESGYTATNIMENFPYAIKFLQDSFV